MVVLGEGAFSYERGTPAHTLSAVDRVCLPSPRGGAVYHVLYLQRLPRFKEAVIVKTVGQTFHE